MKNCPNCGAELEDDAKSCFLCAFSFESEEDAVPEEDAIPEESIAEKPEAPEEINMPIESKPTAEPITPPPAKKRYVGMLVAIVVLFVLVLGLGAVVVKMYLEQNASPKNQSAMVVTTVSDVSVASDETTETTPAITTTVAETTIATTATTTVTTTVAVTTTAVVETEPLIDYACAYGSIMPEAGTVENMGTFFDDYYLYDIDGNGVLELIESWSPCATECCFKFWSIEGNEIVFCGDLEFNHGALYEENGQLYLTSILQGFETIKMISFVDNYISTSIYFDSGDEMLDEFVEVGTSLNGYSYGDYAPLFEASTGTFEDGYYYLEPETY